MNFGRKLSFIGHKIKLELNLRNRLCKELLQVETLGTVKIYDNDPKRHPSPNLIAELTPQICGVGQLYVIWDIPLDLCEGIYYDIWEGLRLQNLPTDISVTMQFYVSDDFLSHEACFSPEFKVEMSPSTIFSGTKEYIKFKLCKPDTMIFPDTTFRIVATTKTDVRFILEERFTGPGFNFPVASNALFPLQAVVISESTVTRGTPFLEMNTFEDTAFFLLDTSGVPAGLYSIQLKLSLGEVQKVIGPFGLTINEPDFNDSNAVFDARIIDFPAF